MKSSTKKLIKWLSIGLLALAVIALAYWKFGPKEPNISFVTATAEKGDIESNVMASGKIKAINTVDVGAQVSGEVTKLYVKVGDVVKKGDLIAQIDQVTQKNELSNSQASYTQSIASLESAKADQYSKKQNLTTAEANLTSKQAALKKAQATLNQANTDLNNANTDLNRMKQLLGKGAISQQEYDQAAAAAKNAQASKDSALASITSAKADIATAMANIESTKADIASAAASIKSQQASVQKAQTDVSTAKQDLSYTTIRAPMDGTIVSVTTEQGSTVNANQSSPTIVTLADLSSVRINAQISEADVIKVKAGMPVYFNVIGSPDDKIDAVLTGVEPAPEEISETSSTDSAIYYIGYVEVPNTDNKFRIDMTAQIYIVIDQAKDALVIPSSAIKERDGKSMVDVLTTDDSGKEMPKPTPVEIGLNNNVDAEVISGLKAGDKVIISQSVEGDSAGKAGGRMGPGMGGPPM